MKFSFNFKVLFAVSFVLGASTLFAHTGTNHSQGHHSPEISADNLEKVKQSYTDKIEPIFRKSCLDCHGQATEMPWYYSVPIVKGFIDNDIKEAKKHLDMTKGFPFGGHGAPIDDLEEISKSIHAGKMPPRNYLFMHSDARLTKDEIDKVDAWIKEAISTLSGKK